jgi:hypothetical protein
MGTRTYGQARRHMARSRDLKHRHWGAARTRLEALGPIRAQWPAARNLSDDFLRTAVGEWAFGQRVPGRVAERH